MLYALEGAKPVLEGDNFVAPEAVAIGRVRLKKRATLWFNAVARGDNEWITIGERSNVQDLSMLHTDVGFPLDIGDDVTVGHRVILHGCMIAGRVLIGMGSVIMNGARIGSDTVIGANSLIGEGKEIPSGVLAFGSPARVKRDLTREELALIRESAEHYAKRGALFRKGLRPLD